MKEIIFIKKKKDEILTDDLVKLFEETSDLEKIKSNVEQAKERITVTWASVDTIDKAGELIPIEDIIKEQDTLLERNGPISDEHTNRIIGETLAWKVLKHPKSKTLGVLHLDKYFDHNEFDDQVWKEIQSGERTGASVGGFNKGESKGVGSKGEDVKVLEGFRQFETASVFDPCNPLALTEAYSVLAKSNKTVVMKPAELDRCVQHLIDDPDFKPRGSNQTKEQAAYAVCQAQLQKKSEVEKFWEPIKKENNINKVSLNKEIIKEGDNMKDNKKAISKIEETLKALQDEITKLKQAPKEEEDEDEEEEKPMMKKEEKKPEEKKPETKKESASGDIEGEGAAKQPKSPEPEDSNDKDVFKKLSKKLDDKFEEIKNHFITKTETPRPSLVNKAKEISGIAMDLAMGKKRMSWNEVHKTVTQMADDMEVV